MSSNSFAAGAATAALAANEQYLPLVCVKGSCICSQRTVAGPAAKESLPMQQLAAITQQLCSN